MLERTIILEQASPLPHTVQTALALWCTQPFCQSFFFSSRRRHTRFDCDWSSDVCSSDLGTSPILEVPLHVHRGVGEVPLALALGRREGLGSLVRTVDDLHSLPAAAGSGLDQIGRASCRERV